MMRSNRQEVSRLPTACLCSTSAHPPVAEASHDTEQAPLGLVRCQRMGLRLIWPRVEVPLSLCAYLYEDAGELIEPQVTLRSLVSILVPTLTLLLTGSLLAFALVYGAAMLLLLYQIVVESTQKEGGSLSHDS